VPVALVKFLRTELALQFTHVLERCKENLKKRRASPRIAEMVLRDRFLRFQMNKRQVLRRVSQDVLTTLNTWSGNRWRARVMPCLRARSRRLRGSVKPPSAGDSSQDHLFVPSSTLFALPIAIPTCLISCDDSQELFEKAGPGARRCGSESS